EATKQASGARAALEGVDYFEHITAAVGDTPLVKIRRITERHNIKCTVLAKLEFLNPAASVKDRMAIWVIEDAIKNGLLKPGGTIIEATSGNTGAAVGMFAAAHGFKAILTCPDKASQEKIDTLKAFGAEVVVCPYDVPADSPENYYQRARAIHAKTENSFFLEQYQNVKNIDAHYYTTGPEIWRQTAGKMTCFVGGIGTGGTVSGCARYFKDQDQSVEVVAADPYGSIYYQYHKDQSVIEPAPYLVEGIGEDMVCQSIDMSVIDTIYQVTDQECFDVARELARSEGILGGGSSGAALSVAIKHAAKLPPDALMVVLLPDSGLKYMSKFYNEAWMREKGLKI
ncbi:MAG TPA: cysteine synthase family protein, partial [candidate division Zixibacteria bacterium]|nr:cysteine synthase family protein [candidate division Zixibacteria bacterium]